MHELSIAANLVDLVNQHLPAGGAKVQSIRLRIGALSCVHADALRFSFELVTEGTLLQGAALEIDTVPVSIYCKTCDSIETLEGIQSFRCPRCATPSADIRSGQELDLESIELIEEEASLRAGQLTLPRGPRGGSAGSAGSAYQGRGGL